MSKEKKEEVNLRTAKRAIWEEKHHKTFDYKEKNKLCIECGEQYGRHTYTCIYYDTEK